MLNADAGKPILMANGQVQLGSDGKPQTYFSATEAQKADAYDNLFPGGSPNTTSSVIPGKDKRDQDRLVRLTAINGSAQPDTTIEEMLFGIRAPARAGGSVVKVTDQAERAAIPGVKGGTGSIANVRAISAEEANAPFVAKGWNPPYDAGSQVRTFTTTSEVRFVRVSTADNPQGAFLVREEEVAGMTPQQVQQYLALPKVPTQISDVIVPAGTKMQVGQVAVQPSFGVTSKGGTQYQLLNPIPSSSFGTPRPIK